LPTGSNWYDVWSRIILMLHDEDRRYQTDLAARWKPFVVLDDDPTGTQAVAGVPVALDWAHETLSEALAARPRAVHVQTNSRALEAGDARAAVTSAARSALDTRVEPRFLLRGDSTLRGHVLEEYLALSEVQFAGRTPPLVLAMALPAAGRITVEGTHYLTGPDGRVALHETEYARDARFS
jgi:uncharacterized protein YgbK (DUF1537 family)